MSRQVRRLAKPLAHKALVFNHTHLCEYPDLEYQGEDDDLHSNGDVEEIVEGVGDKPVRPTIQAVLLHHDQLPLILVLYHGGHENLDAQGGI